jgi:hypothetical protein
MPLAVLIPLLIQILGEAPQVIESVREIWKLATQTTPPTAEQQSAIDAALDEAHKALQDS